MTALMTAVTCDPCQQDDEGVAEDPVTLSEERKAPHRPTLR
jgi:hypothetical protein